MFLHYWRAPALGSVLRQLRSLSSVGTMERDYNAAVAALNTLQSNFSIVDAIRKSGRGMNRQAIPEMIEWCRRIGYEPADFNRLNCIHVAGTKGKGSTSAFISSILAQYGPSAFPRQQSQPLKLHKVGLYTSPHLRFVRERIQLNNQPISESAFAHYFFEVWDRLDASARTLNLPNDTSTKPVYFRFLTLMALHCFLSEGVDTAIVECGIGGEYDSTNILQQPTVTAITSLGIDHVAMLGETIEEIAWHKGGIMKKGSMAFSVEQPERALRVLNERATAKGLELKIAPRHPDIDKGTVRLGLAADFQKINASLAVSVAAAHLRALGYKDVPPPEEIMKSGCLPVEFKTGLAEARWGGRCEVRRERGITWHIDGGHTLESIAVAAKWFAEQISTRRGNHITKRVLLFNQQTRDANALAKALHRTLADSVKDERPFSHAVFCTNITFTSTGYRPDLVSINTNSLDIEALSVQRSLAATWKELDPATDLRVLPTIEEAVACVRAIAASAEDVGDNSQDEDVMVLVTGSLHLVGGVLEVLESQTDGAG